MKKWNVGVYLRLSSDDGDKSESNSIGNQRSLIKRFITNDKELKIIDYYIDDGYSGTTFDRPDFERMIKDIKANKIDCIIVKDLSRLGRNYIEVGNYIEKEFPRYGVRFIAINDNVDSFKDPKSVNNVIVPFKNLMNDEYARDISNKVRSVLDNKRINGQFIGSTAPYGYTRDPNNKYKFKVDSKAAKVVKKIFKMVLDGKSRNEIEKELNSLGVLPPALYKIDSSTYNYEVKEEMKKWNRNKIDKILKNRTYVGDLIQGKRKKISHKIHKELEVDEEEWIVVENHHIPIISREDFEKVQDIIFDRTTRTKKNNEYDLFSGHLRCNECGNNLVLRKSKGYEYYYCSSYLYKKSCTSHSCKKNTFETDVLNIINNYKNVIKDIDIKISDILSKKEINYDLEIINNKITECNKNIDKYAMLRESVKEDLENDFITEDEYWDYRSEYSNKIKENKDEIKKLNKKLENINFKSENNREWLNKYSDGNMLETLDKRIVDDLIEDIVIDKERNIKVIFKDEDKYFEALDFINKQNCDIINNEFLT